MNWVLVPQQVINGLLNGGTLALIALGIVLIFKSSEVFNFAAGHMVMLGAFLTWMFAGGEGTGEELFKLPLWAAVIAASIVAIGIGFLIERLALRPMTGQPLLAIILMTLGLSQVMEGVTTVAYGVQPKGNFPAPFSPSDAFNIPVPPVNGASIVFLDRLQIGHARLATFVVAIIAAVLFILFFQYTKTGLAMRATSENHELAQSMGIKVSRVFGWSWAIAGIVATLGGVLLATLSGVSVSLSTVALVAFPAILLGGLESFPGAIVGGLLVGLAQEIVRASTVVEVRNASDIAPYILLLIILVLRPEGLFGQRRIERI
ncbi:MAG: branched-chain amino acid ABC transporter permease [Ardenticatenaceae bacterium]|nr:branched-chain amino acid ABC transporter permease [Ardenticatenaceae bacterium]